MRRRRSAALLSAWLGLVIVLACTPGGVRMHPTETPQTKLPVAFATALAAGDDELAHGFLATSLRATLSATALAAQYKDMISYGKGAPHTIVAVTAMGTWPDKQPGDVEWVYVAIANDTYSEAVTVVVAEEQGRLVIRSVEWGRP